MRSSPLRLAAMLAVFLPSVASAQEGPPPVPAPPATTAADGQVAAPVAAAPAPEPAPAPAAVNQDSSEAKLAVVLRSFTLMQEENDRLKAALEKSELEKNSLDAQLTEAKKALPVAAQAEGLREQLRQTQNQLAAVSLENNELKTRLATGAAVPGQLSPVSVPTTLAPAVMPPPAPPVPAAPEVKYHVVVAGDTLGKIARQYYGTSSRWPEILEANKDVVKNENSLTVGTKLRIP